MSSHVYKILEIVGSSTESMQGAIENGVRRASKTVRDMRWFQVVETRGNIEDGRIAHWQVTIKIGFTLED